jgi:hypothetical protein
MSSHTFDSSTFSIDPAREPIPAGTYTVRITESIFKPLRTGNGHAVAITYEIVAGPHAKRRIWSNLNVIHTNPEAQRIAQSDLRKLCDACGGIVVTESTLGVLVGRILRIKTKVRSDPTYGDRAEVIGYEGAPEGSYQTDTMQGAQPTKFAPWANA